MPEEEEEEDGVGADRWRNGVEPGDGAVRWRMCAPNRLLPGRASVAEATTSGVVADGGGSGGDASSSAGISLSFLAVPCS